MMKLLFLPVILFLLALNGHAQTLELVSDFNVGSGNGMSSFRDVSFIDDQMIFAATSNEIGRELYIIRDDEVFVLKDIQAGTGSSNPRSFFKFKGFVYFKVTVGGASQIWRTDGTEEGTTMAISFSGSAFSFSDEFIVARNDNFYFTRDDNIYKSDGTQEGTVVITETFDISFEDNFAFATPNADRFNEGIAYVLDRDTAFHLFEVRDSTVTHLWQINLSSQNSFSVVGPFEVERGLVMLVRDGPGNVGDLYLYNKETGITEKYNTSKIIVSQVNRINDDQILITTHDNGNFVTNGTLAGTIKIVNTSAQPSTGSPLPFVRIGDAAFFHSGEPFMADIVHATNGTIAGTRLVKNISGDGISHFISKGQYAFWINDVNFNGEPEVYAADINGTGATKIYDHPTSLNQFNYEINPIGASKQKVYFIAHLDDAIGRELYSIDHQLEITTEVQDIRSAIDCRIIHDRSNASFRIVPGNNDNLVEVYVYDVLGRRISTTRVVDDHYQLPDNHGAYFITVRFGNSLYSTVLLQ